MHRDRNQYCRLVASWVGESGVLTAGMLVLFAVVLYKLWPVTQRASLSPSLKPLSQQSHFRTVPGDSGHERFQVRKFDL